MDLAFTTFHVDGQTRGIGIPPEDTPQFFGGAFLQKVRAFEKIAEEQPTPKEDGLCYQHARELAISSNGNLRYADGLAGTSRGITDFGAGPMESFECSPHAWCINQQGEVVDPGWDAKDGRFYFGILVSVDEVVEHQRDFESDDRKATGPILSLPHLQKPEGEQLATSKEFDAWLGG